MSFNRMVYFGDDSSGVTLGIYNNKSTIGSKDKGTTTWSDLYIQNDSNLILTDGTGKVGIGISTPSKKLEVAGDISCNALTVNGVSITQNGGTGTATVWTTVNTNEIYYNGGNVGIGTNDPSSTLDVNGTIRAGYDSDTASYLGRAAISGISGLGDAATFAHIDHATNTDYALKVISSGVTVLNSTGDLYLCSNSNDANMIIKSSGNVGIGTLSPSKKLEVAGDISCNALTVGGVSITQNGGTGTQVWTTVNTNEIHYSGGYVGIGTNNPEKGLHIYGNSTHKSRLRIESPSDSSSFHPTIELRGGGKNAYIWCDSSGGDFEIWANNDFQFQTEGTTRMQIKSGGNVGIGTTNPSKTLEVAGDISCVTLDVATLNLINNISASKVGLGNVTNESKATMFSSPTFTGTVSGVTATHVGLGNVTNESKATMFSSPTFTGTVSGVTATHVGLGNVTNESKATMFSSPTFTGTVSGVTATHVGLGNVTNESKATMFTDPAFTGNATATTQSNSNNSTRIATTAFVKNNISDLINGAPGALDTLNELASALDNSANFASNITNRLTTLENANNSITTEFSVTTSGGKYYIDGNQQQTITFLKGFTYKFDQSDSTNSSHPLRFSTTSDGTHNSGSEYTTGVTTSGTAGSSGAYIQITVDKDAPNLYYYCSNHSGMGGSILVKHLETTIDSKQATIDSNNRLNANLINDGNVDNTEFGYLNGVTSNIQTQLNSKQATINSSNRLNANLINDGNVDNTEFGYLNGVTSSIQTQLDSKQATISDSNRINANLINDGNVDNTEFGYLNGVTSSIQTQLDSKQATITSSTDLTTGDISGADASFNKVEFSGGILKGHLIPDISNVYDIGSATHPIRELFLGPSSLYIDGKKVIESNADTINVTTDNNQNLTVKTTGSGLLKFESAGNGISMNTSSSGDITLAPNGSIKLNSNIQIANGIEIQNPNGDDINFIDNVTVSSGKKFIGDGSFNTVTLAGTSLETTLNSKQATIDSSNRLDADLIHDGSVSNTQFGYLNGVTSSIQTQLDSKQSTHSTSTDLSINDIKAVDVSAGAFFGPLYGNVTGTIQTASQSNITSVGTLTGLSVNGNVLTNNIKYYSGSSVTIKDSNLVIEGNATISGSGNKFIGDIQGDVTGDLTGTIQTASQTNITSIGTLGSLQVDNINIDGNTISTDGGTDLTIKPLTGNDIILDASNVGIGTNNPVSKLDVNFNSSTVQALTLRNGNGNAINDGAQIAFSHLGSSSYKHFIHTRHAANNSNLNAMDFYVCDGTTSNKVTSGSNHVMTLDGSGNVGIGTTNPIGKLQISTSDDIDATDSSNFDKYSLILNKVNTNSTNTEIGLCFDIQSTNYPTTIRGPGAAITHERTDSWSKGKLHFKTKQSTNQDDDCVTSMTISDDGNVGIGTTNPSEKLHVLGNIRLNGSSSNGVIHFRPTYYIYTNQTNTSGDVGQIRFINRDTNKITYLNGHVFYGDHIPSIRFIGKTAWNGDSIDILTLRGQSGKVGINTTNPGAKLHLVNDISNSVSADTFNLTARFETNGYDLANSNPLKAINFGSYNTVPAIMGGGTNTSYDLVINPGLNSTAGHVGIGTGLPRHKLHIAGNAEVFALEGSDHAYMSFYPDGYSGGRKGYFGYPGASSEYIELNTESSSRPLVLQLTGGNVGIGTTNPSTDLQIGNTSNKSTDTILTLASDGLDSNKQGIRMIHHGTDDSNQYGWYMMGSDIDDLLHIGHYYGGTTEYDNIVLKRYHDSSNKGNFSVGIGTTNPTKTLEVAGDISCNALTVAGVSITGSGGGSSQWTTVNTNEIHYSGGYVGIGTNNPNYNLHIHDSNIPYIHLTNSTTGTTNNDGTSISLYEDDLYIRNREDGGNIKIQTKDGSTEPMTILAGGNVGIGTTNPISKLHVYTSDNSETALRIIGNGGSSSVLGKCGIGFRINKNITNSSTTYEDQGGIVMEEKDIADSQANMLFKIKQTSGYDVLPTTAMMIRYDGNVGIGTTNPDEKLRVTGKIVGIKIGGGSSNIPDTGYGESTIAVFGYGSETNQYGIAMGTLSSGPSWLQSKRLYHTTSSSQSSKFHFLINPDGGNVGIGTTDAQAKLHVQGGSVHIYNNISHGTSSQDSLMGSQAGSANLYLDCNNGSGTDKNGIIWKTKYNITGGNIYTKKSAGIYFQPEASYFRGGLGFYTNNSGSVDGDQVERMRIDMDGNVGIGTTNPQTYLHIQATNSTPLTTEGDMIGAHNLTEYLRFTSKGDSGDINSVSAGFKLGEDDSHNSNPNGRLDVCANGGAGTVNEWGGSPNVTVASFIGNGRVGIGTTNPSAPLSICGSNTSGNTSQVVGIHMGVHDGQYSYMDMVSSNDNGGWIDFKDTTGNSDYLGRIRYFNSDNKFVFSTNTTDKMVINSGGNVGIGTTNPNYKLEISNDGGIGFNDSDWDTDYTTQNRGIFWSNHSDNKFNYGIYQGRGNWTQWDFQQLTLAWKTGIILNPRATGTSATPTNTNNKSHVGVAGSMAIGTSYYSVQMKDNAGLDGALIVQEKVGIGTTKPLNLLDIQNLSGNAVLGVMAKVNVGFSAISLGEPKSGDPVNGHHGIQIRYDGDDNKLYIGEIDGHTTFYTALTLTRDSRRLGINDTTPAGYLDVGGTIYSNGSSVSSDRRIKTNIVDVSDNQALDILRNIPCRYYEYKDKKHMGHGHTIGFIAQEVNEQFPIAVKQTTKFIPNIMKNVSDYSWNSILYDNSDNLITERIYDESGNDITVEKYKLTIPDLSDNYGNVKYRFYVSEDPSGNDDVIVEKMKDVSNSFIFEKQWPYVLVYGTKVNDFNYLDKQKLFALNFSATQEIDKQQQADKLRIATLEAEVASLKTKNQSLEQEIDAIKQYLGL